MATKIPFKPKPSRVPDSLWLAHLINAATTVTACMKNPEKADHLAEMLYQSVTAFIASVPDEMKPRTAHVDIKKWIAFARLRMKFDRVNLKILRDAIYPEAARPGLLVVRQTVDLLIKDLDRAYAACPPLDDERDRELPEVELPDPSPATTAVAYGEILDE